MRDVKSIVTELAIATVEEGLPTEDVIDMYYDIMLKVQIDVDMAYGGKRHE